MFMVQVYPQGRQPFSSPLPKLRGHAKVLSGLIADSNHTDRDLGKIYCDTAVILTAPNAQLHDTTGHDEPRTTTLAKAVRFSQTHLEFLIAFLKNIKKYDGAVISAITGKAKPMTGPPRLVIGRLARS